MLSHQKNNNSKTDSYSAISLSPNGLVVATGFDSGKIMLLDLNTEKEFLTLKGHRGKISTLLFSPDNRFLLSGATDGRLILWDPFIGKIVKTLKAHKGKITDLAFNSTGELLASSSADHSIKIWDRTNKWKQLKEFKGHQKEVLKVLFIPQTDQIISCSKDHTIKIWDTSSGKLVKELKGHFGSVESIAVSSDGKMILSGSDDGILNVWFLHQHFKNKQLSLYHVGVSTIKIHPQGTMFVCGLSDGTVSIWNFESLQKLKAWKEHSNKIIDLYYTPDGAYLLSLSMDHTIKIWKIEKILEEKQKGILCAIKSTFSSSEFGKLVKGVFSMNSTEKQLEAVKNSEETLQRMIEELPELVSNLVDGEQIHVNDIKQRYRAQRPIVEKAILTLLREKQIIGQFNPFTGVLVIDRNATKEIINEEEQVEPRVCLEQTCFYCGIPVDNVMTFCSSCQNELVRCPICKLNVSFEDEIGVCVFCGSKGHLNHMKESMKVFGCCPICQRELNWEAEILPFKRLSKK